MGIVVDLGIGCCVDMVVDVESLEGVVEIADAVLSESESSHSSSDRMDLFLMPGTPVRRQSCNLKAAVRCSTCRGSASYCNPDGVKVRILLRIRACLAS